MSGETLPICIRKYRDTIHSISDERCNGDGYWVYLMPGWINTMHGVHHIHEDTPQDCVSQLKDCVEPCDCEDCKYERSTQ